MGSSINPLNSQPSGWLPDTTNKSRPPEKKAPAGRPSMTPFPAVPGSEAESYLSRMPVPYPSSLFQKMVFKQSREASGKKWNLKPTEKPLDKYAVAEIMNRIHPEIKSKVIGYFRDRLLGLQELKALANAPAAIQGEALKALENNQINGPWLGMIKWEKFPAGKKDSWGSIFDSIKELYQENAADDYMKTE